MLFIQTDGNAIQTFNGIENKEMVKSLGNHKKAILWMEMLLKVLFEKVQSLIEECSL